DPGAAWWYSRTDYSSFVPVSCVTCWLTVSETSSGMPATRPRRTSSEKCAVFPFPGCNEHCLRDECCFSGREIRIPSPRVLLAHQAGSESADPDEHIGGLLPGFTRAISVA